MKLYLAEPNPPESGHILLVDEDNNDIAEFFHNGHSTVPQSYETARSLVCLLISAEQHAQATTTQPRVTDNDDGEIAVSLDGKELRGWSYSGDMERRAKMLCAREYVEGWCDGKGLS